MKQVMSILLSFVMLFSIVTGLNINAVAGEVGGFLFGDINDDGKVDLMDVLAISKHIKGDSNMNDEQIILADVDGNGTINDADLNYITSFVQGTISQKDLPVYDYIIELGNCGKKAKWILYDDYRLVIFGSGEMADYNGDDKAPWKAYKDQIMSVSIGGEITKIGRFAFSKCSMIADVTIPESVVEIGDSAFYDCKSLLDISVPDSIRWMGEYAFSSTAYEAKASNWSGNILYLGKYLLRAKQSITYCSVKSGTLVIASDAFNCCVKMTSVSFPNSLITIGDSSFIGCEGLKAVKLPNSVENIGSSAFAECTSLKALTLSSNIKTIEWGAFDCCSSLESVTIPEGLKRIEDFTFSACSSLTSVSLPDTLEYIGYGAFEGSGITSLTIPNNVKTIDTHAFLKCKKLTELTIPQGVDSIRYQAFKDCALLNNITILNHKIQLDEEVFLNTGCYNNSDNWSNNALYIDNILIKAKPSVSGTYTVKEGTRSISDYAFSYCSNLKSVDIADSVLRIGEEAFRGCDSLESVSVGKNVEEIGSACFYDCVELSNINLPQGISNLEQHLFYNCAKLKKIAIPKNVQIIKDYAFTDCSGIEEISFGDNVTEIGDWAFCNCTSLTKIVFPKELTSIGESTFWGCSNLREITLTNKIRKIGKSSFYLCKKLKDVYFYGSAKDIENITIEDYDEYMSYITIHYCCYEHTWNDGKIVKKPTCTGDGEMVYTCLNCGETKTTILPQSSHDIYLFKVAEPTCETDGVTAYRCSVCDEIIGFEYTPAYGHRWDAGVVTIAPSCTSKGETTFTCLNDSHHTYTVEIPAFGHNWREWIAIKDATCTESGIEQRICANDNNHIEYRETEALGHNFVSVETALPTCAEQGYNVYSCTICHESFKEIYAPAMEHKYNVIESEKATCTTDGYNVYRCENCGNTYTQTTETAYGHNRKDEIIAPTCEEKGYTIHHCVNDASHDYTDSYVNALDHSWDNGSIIKEATCMEPGTIEYTCERDSSHKRYEKTDMLSHDCIVTDSAEATCTSDGYILYRCSICNLYEYKQIIPATGHNYKAEIVKAPTCTERGYTKYVCTNNGCNDGYISYEEEPTGHNPASTVIENQNPATCTEKGSYDEVIYCTICSAEISRKTISEEALGHLEITDVGIKPTCTESGLTEGTHCARCNQVLVAQKGIEATEHNFTSWSIVTPPSQCYDGLSIRICNNCNKIENLVLPALGTHSYKKEITEPTCTNGGYTTFVCSYCGDTYTTDYISATGHTEIIDKRIEPTCTEKGLTQGSHCGICMKTIVPQKEISSIGHIPSQAETENAKEPSCTENGSHDEVTYCLKCGAEIERKGIIDEAYGHHDYIAVVTEPTCTEKGYTTYTCAEGDDIYTGNYVTENGHAAEAIPAVPSTCTETGLTDGSKCSVCGEIITKQQITEPLGHKYTSLVTKNATCTESGTVTYICQNDSKHTYTEEIPVLNHNYETVVTEPTCTEQGYTTYKCSECNKIYTDDYVDAKGHMAEEISALSPTCTKTGLTEGSYCLICNEILIAQETVAMASHNYENIVSKARLSKNGKIVPTCSECGATKAEKTIYCPKTYTLSSTSYTYDGKAKKPTIKVVDSNGKTISSSNYTLTYSNNKNVGKASVKITFKGNYSGSKTLSFTINPKGTTISSLTASSKGYTAKWKKQATQTTGYQIQYSTSSKFTNAKIVTVSKNSTTSTKVTKLTARKKYYVRIRTYKTVSGTKYYSSWSGAKSVTTK